MRKDNILQKSLKKYRERAKFSQAELASEIDISQTQIGKIENGQSDTTVTVLKNICLVLNVSPVDLLFSDDEKNRFLSATTFTKSEVTPESKLTNGSVNEDKWLEGKSALSIVGLLKYVLKRDADHLDDDKLACLYDDMADCMRYVESHRKGIKAS